MSWWNNRHHDNLLIVMYEDMLHDLSYEVKKIIKFLEIKISDDHFQKVLASATFSAMSDNSAANYSTHPMINQSMHKFLHSGKIGQWKDHFTVAQNEWFDEKYGPHLKASGMNLRYE